jgi:glycosyltransferase involved in cell wall biosynthesis
MKAPRPEANGSAVRNMTARKENTGTFKFIIPIRHPGNVRDKSNQQRCLAQTLASLDAQTDRNFEILIAANEGQELPALPERAKVAHVNLPRNDVIETATDPNEVYESIKIDKGNRVRAAFAFVDADDCVMVVDDDDLVSRHLVEQYRQLDRSKGWYINLGYLWPKESRWLTKSQAFFEICGTSLIVPAHFYAYFSAPEIGETDIIRELGSHRLIFDRRSIDDGYFRPFPIRGAIYRVGHSNATQTDVQRARGVQSQSQKPRKGTLVQAIKRRLRIAYNFVLGKTQRVPLNAKIRNEFFGAFA